MGSRKYHNREWLRERYEDDIMTLGEIGDLCDVSRTTISDWLDRHGIEKRTQKETQRLRQEGPHTDREWLAKQYHGKQRSLSDMAEDCGVDAVTVMNWMERHNIPRRGYSDHAREEKVQRVTTDRAYIRLDSRNPDKDNHDSLYEHQLVAIANGADPHKVFSDGAYQCHHKNGIPWDNRPENIEVLTDTEHANEHWPMRERADTGEFL